MKIALTVAQRGALMTAAVAASLLISGCSKPPGGSGGTGGGGGGGTANPTFIGMSGNWMLTGSGSSGGGAATPITMSGVIAEQAASGASRFTTSVLRLQAPCYLDAQIVPLDGQVTETRYQSASFDVKGQYLSLDALKNTDATQLTGAYTIKGGCADGQSGKFTGQRYADLTGTYAGATSVAGRTVSIAVTEDTNGTGDGTFIISGTAQFTGFSCFTSGQIGNAGSSISGSNVDLQFTANDQGGSQVRLQGQIDPGAQTLTLSAAGVTGGSCSGDLGQFVMKKQ